MTTEKIKEYLGMVLDMEMSLYVQRKTINNLCKQYDNLGKRKYIAKPKKKESAVSPARYMKVASITTGLSAEVIYGIYKMIQIDENSNSIYSRVSNTGDSLLWIFIVGILGMFLGAFVIGLLIWGIVQGKDQKVLNREYKEELKKYNILVEQDILRAKNELIPKQKVFEQIEILDKQYKDTEKNLMELYSYNIIHNDYKRDIVAISSFYQYFCKGITLSLQFDPNTGDDGAYKIYENEKRLNLIISKIDIAIQKLNEIATTQTVLFDAINKANHTIDRLSNDINNNHKHLSAQINEQTAIEEYQHERILKELEYHNFMDDIYRRK